MNTDKKFVSVTESGVAQIHMQDWTGNYATLCGMDGDDPHPAVRQITTTVPAGAKINCQQCRAIYEAVSRYSPDDFVSDGEHS